MITSIRLQNFRSYSDDSFEFDPAVNIVVGPNASGKTNLLESIYLLASGSSYKARDIDVIKFGSSWARSEAFFGKQPRVVKLAKNGETVSKEFLIDQKPYTRLSLEKKVPLVFFEPNHLQLLSRGPEQRREYIDGLLENSVAGYKKLANNYRRALAQRNALLKKPASLGKNQLFAWDVRLSELGGEIASARTNLIKEINRRISRAYSQIAQHKSLVKLEYQTHFPAEQYASRMLSKLETSTKLDYERGFTGCGPHREDVVFFLNKKPANLSASRGETRSLILALKYCELELIEKARGQNPILLLDDVFSELDGSRRRMLVEFLGNRQALITTTDADAAVKHFSDNHKLISVERPA